MLRNYFKYIVYLYVLIHFSLANAGSYEDFFKAIQQDDARTVQSLLQRGFDPNTRDPKQQHGLYLALREPSLKVAKVLIDWPKTDLNASNPADETPLMMAVLKGQVELVSAMLAKDADVNKTGWTPLHYAATSGHIALINLLLEKHAYIDAESPNGSTPLMMAVLKGQVELVSAMLAKDADVNKTGWTPLHYAATSGNIALINLLLEKHAYIDAESPNGSTPLMMAAMYGTPGAVKLLLEEGADPLLKNQIGLSAIDFAQKALRQESADIIGAFVRAKQPKGTW